jgi:hypothetical protein
MNFLKKITGGNNFFKKAEGFGNNLFHKTAQFIGSLPEIAQSAGNTVKNIANEIQKKSSQYGGIASDIALSLGRPDLAGLINTGRSMINNYNSTLQNGINSGQQKITNYSNMLAQ